MAVHVDPRLVSEPVTLGPPTRRSAVQVATAGLALDAVFRFTCRPVPCRSRPCRPVARRARGWRRVRALRARRRARRGCPHPSQIRDGPLAAAVASALTTNVCALRDFASSSGGGLVWRSKPGSRWSPSRNDARTFGLVSGGASGPALPDPRSGRRRQAAAGLGRPQRRRCSARISARRLRSNASTSGVRACSFRHAR